MATQDFSVWKDRFQAVDATINDLLQQSEFTSAEGQPFRGLLERLRAFAQSQFDFFYDGFGTHEIYHLVPSREFHPEYVFKVTLEQVTTDLEFIRRAANERVYGSAEMKQVLETADRLAWSALQPVVGPNGLIKDEQTTVITYFRKVADIRLIPYAPVALVGLPLTARAFVQDYLAIGHEIGHYVYRNGWLDDQRLAKELDWCLIKMGSPKWVRKWREEIFADVYNCLVGGPVMALASQDLALESSLTPFAEYNVGNYRIIGELETDDGEHPVAVIRPYIYTKVLEAMDLNEMAQQLKKRWQAFPQVQAVKNFEAHYSNTGIDRIDVKLAQQAVEEVVEAILEDIPNPHSDVWQRWSGDPDGGIEPLDQLYASFRERLPDLTTAVAVPSSPALSPSAADLAALWQNWIRQEQFFPGFPIDHQPPPATAIAIEPGKPSKLEYLEQEPRYTWIHVLLAGGWATKIGNHYGG